jgi:putative iron-regulated protein
MKKISVSSIILYLVVFAACNKAPDTGGNTAADFAATEKIVLNDFTNNVALGGYLNLSVASSNLNVSLQNLNSNTTEGNLTIAKTNWKNLRQIWEQCEGFLFGPVEDNDYDPNMDTWPTDYTQMDSLLNSANALEVIDIQNLTLSLRGFHPIEYIIFGDHGNRTAASITARQKKYMISLSTDLNNTCNALYLSWSSSPVNFAQAVINAGNGSTVYASKKEAFLAMTGAMTDICDEVGDSKMKEPYDASDPKLVESPYSGNSLADFKNNITGLQNVYLGLNGGKGIKDLVAAKNKSLDNTIQSQITTAINSFDNITVVYEQAIITQRMQALQTMTALNALKTTLENELVGFIQQNIKD